MSSGPILAQSPPPPPLMPMDNLVVNIKVHKWHSQNSKFQTNKLGTLLMELGNFLE